MQENSQNLLPDGMRHTASILEHKPNDVSLLIATILLRKAKGNDRRLAHWKANLRIRRK